MKNFKHFLAYFTIFSLILTSCSNEEIGEGVTAEKATLSFEAIVADLANNSTNRQSDFSNLPECSDAAPAYVEIVLMQGENYIIGEDAPYRVNLVAGQTFTEEDAALELEPGQYSLEHFAVYDAQGNLIWIAPKGGILSEFVDAPLPLNIELAAGVKKYVDVSVICFDDRDVNEYGYQFFEFETTKAIEFCFFANYCLPGGDHYPARFSVEFSIDGTVIHKAENNINSVGVNNAGDLYAESICLALPDLPEYADDVKYLDYTVTLLDWEGVYDAPDDWVIKGSLSRDDVEANFDGPNKIDPEHLRFGCDEQSPGGDNDNDNGDGDDGDDNDNGDGDDNDNGDGDDGDGDDGDGDGNDSDDNAVGEGCETAYMIGDNKLNALGIYNGNNWGWGLVLDGDSFDDQYYIGDGVWRIPFHAGAGQNDTSKGWQAGHIVLTLHGNNLEVDFDLYNGVSLEESHIWVGSNWPASRAPGQFDLGRNTFSVGSGPHYIIVHGKVCGN